MTCGVPPSTAYAGDDHWPCKMLRPGDLSVHSTFFVFLSRAMKLGACGAGMPLCASSTPFDVHTKSLSPALVTEQSAMLCCDTPSSFIMSKTQTTSASSLCSLSSLLYGPLFLPS